MVKKILFIVLVGIGYLIYARFVLMPHIYKNFSLIDDGQSIKYGYYLGQCFSGKGCNGFRTQVLDMESGRSRIGYWLIQGMLYQGPAVNAQFQHEFRVYGFGLIIVALMLILCLAAGSNFVSTILATAVFITNYSFSENIMRLGPIEPYQVIFLGLFSLFFLNQQFLFNKRKRLAFWVSAITLILFILLKETSIVLLPIVFVLGLLFPKIFNRKSTIALVVISGLVFLLVKYLFSGAGIGATYVRDYKFDIWYVFQNSRRFLVLLSNSLSPFIKIFAGAVFICLAFKKIRTKIFNHHFVYWFLLFALSTAILFPWKYVLDRYLLVSIFSFSILISMVMTALLKPIEKLPVFSGKGRIAFQLITFLGMTNLFFRGAPINIARTLNYRNWFSTFTQFEAEQVKAISKYRDGVVYLNAKDIMDNWETVYEIPLHLEYFYGGRPDTKRLSGSLPTRGYLFSRTLLDPVISLDTLSKSKYLLLDSKEYHVTQIDPIGFRELFKFRPIQALQNPPQLEEGFDYYWEVRKL